MQQILLTTSSYLKHRELAHSLM